MIMKARLVIPGVYVWAMTGRAHKASWVLIIFYILSGYVLCLLCKDWSADTKGMYFIIVTLKWKGF